MCNSCVVKQLLKYVQQLSADGPAGRCPCSTGRGGRKVAPAANVSRCQSARPAIRTSTNATQNAATNTQPTTQQFLKFVLPIRHNLT